MSGKNMRSSAKPVESEEEISLKDYNHVALNATLQSIRLLKLTFDCRPERMADDIDLSLSYGRSVLSCQHDETTDLAAAVLQYNVAAKSGRAKAFQCIAEYAVVYAIPEDATAASAIRFCRQVGSFAAYPYFRAVAAQMAWNGGIDLPPLPAIAAMPVIPKVKAKDMIKPS